MPDYPVGLYPVRSFVFLMPGYPVSGLENRIFQPMLPRKSYFSARLASKVVFLSRFGVGKRICEGVLSFIWVFSVLLVSFLFFFSGFGVDDLIFQSVWPRTVTRLPG